MKITAQLLEVATTYCRAKDLSLSRVSTLVFNDGKKLDLIRSGKDIYTGRFEAALRWFSDNWPSDTPWPSTVQRPAVGAADPASNHPAHP